MPQFKVEVEEVLTYIVPVEAKDMDEARELAVERVRQGGREVAFRGVAERAASFVYKETHREYSKV